MHPILIEIHQGIMYNPDAGTANPNHLAAGLLSVFLANDTRAGTPRVNEDRATNVPANLLQASSSHDVESDSAVLARVESCLRILADLVHGDTAIYVRGSTPGTAVLVASAQPSTAPSVATSTGPGDIVGQSEEPDVIRAFSRGTLVRRVQRARAEAPRSLLDVYPVRDGTLVVGALAIETGLTECERLQRKSVVYRRALDRLRRSVVTGTVRNAEALRRLGEYDGSMVVTASGQIVYVSSLAEQLYRKLGYADSLLGRNLAMLRTDEAIVARALESGNCLEEDVQQGPFTWRRRAIPLLESESGWLWSRVNRQRESRAIVIVTVSDVTAETQRERELRIKSAMIQEIHHRVKNNLQTIAALLRIQARRTDSRLVSDILQQTISRILSIAYVHDYLAHQESNEVDMSEVAQQIISEVTQGILDPGKRVRIALDSPRICLSNRQATSCALVLSELLHNAVEHGFATATEGNVYVRFAEEGNRVAMEVADDGQGLPPNFSLRDSGSLGLQIVQTLVRDDLKGTFQLVDQHQRGTKGTVAFPRFE
jgi:two-component sensor histidine kinase